MIRKFGLIFLIYLPFFYGNLFAQEYYFSSYSVNDGLSQSVVNCVYQDSKGYIWIGTQNGLNKFNGYNFKKYIHSPVDTLSISDNWIFKIVEDRDSNLWIGTKGGLNRYNRKTDDFTLIEYENLFISEINSRVYGIDIDENDNIIINTPPVLTIYNPKTNSIESYQSELEFEASDKNEEIPVLIDNQNNIWIASNRGLSVFNIEKKSYQYFKSDIIDHFCISKDTITSLFEDQNENIWIGTSYGLNKYDKTSGTFTKYFYEPQNSNSLSGNYIHTIVQDDNGFYWVGTDAGLNKFSVDKNGKLTAQRFNSETNSLSHDVIHDLMIDFSKNLWIGTLKGIDKTDLKSKKFKLYQKTELQNSYDLLDNVVASLYKDDEGKIWIGNWGKGLNILNRKTKEVEHYSSSLTGNNYIPNDYVHVIFEDNQKRVWIGTRSGVLIFNKISKNFIPIQQYFQNTDIPSFENLRVNSIVQDKNSDMWFGTQNGLYHVNLKLFTTEIFTAENTEEPKLCGNYIYELLFDSDEILWIATTNGLNAFDIKANSIVRFQKDKETLNSLCDNFVVSLCEDYEGNIWIGTNTGVNKYSKKEKNFTFYYHDEGLPANLVYEILEDANTNLWFATGAGLALFDRKLGAFKTFSLEEGLQSLEFNLGGKYKSADGEVFFGGMNGFNSFYPDSLNSNPYIPEIVFTNFELIKGNIKENIRIDNVDFIELQYDVDAFTIEFAALEFTNNLNNEFAYMMTGIGDNEDVWIEIGNRHFVPFSNLPPGEYIFKVKGTNNDGVWNNEGLTLKIRINPPWWKSNLAIIIYIILIVTFVVLFIKIREQRLIKERNILEQKVKERTIEINQQKEKIEKAHIEITDSINYGSRIQTAMLPKEHLYEQYFSEYFILYKPKDVVSGDFYWFKKVREYVVFAVADCTGHGVPGAFVSMLGMSLLNEIIRREEVIQSFQVLNELREELKSLLNQKNFQSESKDGMDIAFCIYNSDKKILDYSGANIPLNLIKNGTSEITEYKPSKNPIGIYYKEKNFESTFIDIQTNDIVYLFSDGYVDQFNEINGEKYKLSRLKIKLSNIAHLPLDEQKRELDANHYKWKGSSYQIDDILIFGVKFL